MVSILEEAKEASSFVEDQKNAMLVVAAVGAAIKELGSVPSGVLYSQLQGRMSLNAYMAIVNTLKAACLVREKHNLLTWIAG